MTVLTMVWLHDNRCANRCVVEMLTEKCAAAGEEGAPSRPRALASLQELLAASFSAIGLGLS